MTDAEPTNKIRPTTRNIWAVSLPVIVAGLSESVVEVTDTIFLARYGLTELAAIGLADTMYGLAMFAAVGLVDGIQILMARRAGQDRARAIGAIFNQGLYVLGAISVVLVVAIKALSPYLTNSLIHSTAVAESVDSFLQIFAFAMLFHAVNLAFSAFYIGISRTRVLIGATAVLAVTNIGLDYALIFGNWGFPELGIRGAAMGSLAAEIAAFAFLTLYAITRGDARRYELFRFRRWNSALTSDLVWISLPVALEGLAEMGRWLVFFLILERVSEQTLAWGNIVYSCYAVLLIPIAGLSETACSMTSNLVGQDEGRQIGRLLRRAVSLGFAVVLPFLALATWVPELILSVFTEDPETLAACANAVRAVSLAALVAVPAEMFFSAVAGTGDTRLVLLIELAMTSVILACAWFTALVLGLSLAYVWLAETAGWAVCLLLSWAWLRSGRWKRLEF